MSDKSQLANYLQQHSLRTHKLADLKEHFPDVVDRTLRRWLTALVEQGLVERRGANKGTVYQWSKIEWQPINWHESSPYQHAKPIPITEPASPTNIIAEPADTFKSLVFSASSRELLQQVQAPLYTRAPVTFNEAWLNSYEPNQSYYLTDTQRALLHRTGKREGIQGKAQTYIQKILNRLIIDLSYHSARLEGNTYSLADTEKLVLQGIAVDGKLNEERIMILNHKEAIRYLVQNVTDIRIDEHTIRTLHYLLADGLVAPGMAGNIRRDAIGISGTTYAPLEGEQRLATLLGKVLNKAAQIHDCFEQSFFLLGHIAYLQAFIDVNKRTARLASIIPLITRDYVPQSFIDVEKDDYLHAVITFYELNRVEPLAELFVWSYIKSCQRYDVFTEVVSFDEIAALYRVQRRMMIADIVRNTIRLSAADAFIRKRMPADVATEHNEKFIHDVLTELRHLNLPRIAGMGITQEEFERWAAMADLIP